MSEEKDILSEAIKKQSRLLADNEVIDACDLIMGDNGYRAVPDEMIGKCRMEIGIGNKVRRWYGLLSELNAQEKRRKDAEKKS